MLGELYKPRGLALETAQAVLQVKDPYAVNVAYGCSNQCAYCYVPRFTRQKRYESQKVRLPKKPPIELVRHQLEYQWRFHPWKSDLGVFLSFLTDPFLPEVDANTLDLIRLLRNVYGIRVATLSKLDCSSIHDVRQGMTLVSLDNKFWMMYEPNTVVPEARLIRMRTCKQEFGDYVWVSMEPYPPSSIYKQDLLRLLEELTFVDLIVFGKWNYDSRANTEEARREYAADIEVLTDFCKSNNVRCHIKSDTVDFCLSEFS